MPNPQLQAVPAAANAKRKNAPRDDEDDGASDSGSDVSMINVDFDFYNLNTDVDQIAIKRFLRQTLSHDDNLIDVHPLADLILSEASRLGAGTSIKTDGEESDPWGLLAVVDIRHAQETPALKPLIDYFLSTSPPAALASVLDKSHASRPALLFSLRMLNLPLPLIPPLYKMIGSELADADFSHYVLWGRGYKLQGTEAATGLELDQATKGNKKKKGGNTTGPGLVAGSFTYHPEEDLIDARAKVVHTYPLKTAPSRDDEAFGVEQFGRLVLADAAGLAKAVEDMEEAVR
ncbi:Protein BCP1 [Vanrija pseudolonga]|uniref:Protein BCP1 n=1 Tax=Vanrija pseudolonga TaxID=143232 RepID=A0AAF0Y7K9_9TREE|nr:Protein BCP1 [Vanrija pseudolonga]